jgi:hypothetical protein
MRAVWVLATVVACKSAPETSATTTTTTSTVAAVRSTATASGSAKVGGAEDVTWTMPATWTSEPSVGMRKATYRIAKTAGDKEDATVSIIQAGGSVDDNIARWKSQFDGPHDPSRRETKVGDFAVTIAEVHGTYTGGGMMVGESPDPRPGWALVAAIVQTSSQPYFFKMLGPDKTVAAAKSDFQALVDSIRAK